MYGESLQSVKTEGDSLSFQAVPFVIFAFRYGAMYLGTCATSCSRVELYGACTWANRARQARLFLIAAVGIFSGSRLLVGIALSGTVLALH